MNSYYLAPFASNDCIVGCQVVDPPHTNRRNQLVAITAKNGHFVSCPEVVVTLLAGLHLEAPECI